MKLEAKTSYKITQCDSSLLKMSETGTITQTHHVQAMWQNFNNNTQMQTSQVSRFDRVTHDFRASKFPFITVIFRTLPYFPVYWRNFPYTTVNYKNLTIAI